MASDDYEYYNSNYVAVNNDLPSYDSYLFWGDGGDDSIYLLAGEDGDDTIYGDETGSSSYPGADQIYGGAGADTIRGGSGNDTIHGDDGSGTATDGGDTIWGDFGSDSIFGGKGADHLYGDDDYTEEVGDGADTIDGGDDGDTLYGNACCDSVNGGAGSDTCDCRDAGDSASYTGEDTGCENDPADCTDDCLGR